MQLRTSKGQFSRNYNIGDAIGVAFKDALWLMYVVLRFIAVTFLKFVNMIYMTSKMIMTEKEQGVYIYGKYTGPLSKKEKRSLLYVSATYVSFLIFMTALFIFGIMLS
jgi:hypothetical protein